MEPSDADWLNAIAQRLGLASSPVDDEIMRMLLRVTKVAADATGVRYLAPLTSYLIGVAAGGADALGKSFELRSAVDEISALAERWPRQTSPTAD